MMCHLGLGGPKNSKTFSGPQFFNSSRNAYESSCDTTAACRQSIPEVSEILDDNCRNKSYLKIACPKISYGGYTGLLKQHYDSHSEWHTQCQCDKKWSDVNIVTIMTTKTFTAGIYSTDSDN